MENSLRSAEVTPNKKKQLKKIKKTYCVSKKIDNIEMSIIMIFFFCFFLLLFLFTYIFLYCYCFFLSVLTYTLMLFY